MRTSNIMKAFFSAVKAASYRRSCQWSLIICIFGAAFSANAQDAPVMMRGKKIIGGELSGFADWSTTKAGTNKVNDTFVSEIAFSPQAGYFHSDYLELDGVVQSYSMVEIVKPSQGDKVINSLRLFGIGANPHLYFFRNDDGKIRGYVELSAVGGWGRSKKTEAGKETEADLLFFSVGGGAGVAFILGREKGSMLRVGPAMNYMYTKKDMPSPSDDAVIDGMHVSCALGIFAFL